eukprot:gene35580-52744_t
MGCCDCGWLVRHTLRRGESETEMMRKQVFMGPLLFICLFCLSKGPGDPRCSFPPLIIVGSTGGMVLHSLVRKRLSVRSVSAAVTSCAVGGLLIDECGGIPGYPRAFVISILCCDSLLLVDAPEGFTQGVIGLTLLWIAISSSEHAKEKVQAAVVMAASNPHNRMWDTWLYADPNSSIPFYLNYLSNCDTSCGGPPGGAWNGVGAALSTDGVHFADEALVVGGCIVEGGDSAAGINLSGIETNEPKKYHHPERKQVTAYEWYGTPLEGEKDQPPRHPRTAVSPFTDCRTAPGPRVPPRTDCLTDSAGMDCQRDALYIPIYISIYDADVTDAVVASIYP